MGRGWQGAVLKALRARDFTLTVKSVDASVPEYVQLKFDDGGLLGAVSLHPTIWIRLWFANAPKPHQRAYTLIDPDPASGTFDIGFSLHGGPASEWARAAKPGDRIEATVWAAALPFPRRHPGAICSSETLRQYRRSTR